MLTAKEFENHLKPYLPEGTASTVGQYLAEYPVIIKISKKRATKLGDYRPPFKDQYHRISVNHDLNQYAFLTTLVHEIAHLYNWIDFKQKIKPHGKEWKQEFKQLMLPFFQKNVFPKDVERALASYLTNPAASSCTDRNLFQVLKKYDQNPVTHLEDLPEGSIFQLNNQRIFKKQQKLRTRYRCMDLRNKRYYLINGLAEVKTVN
jgi:hypothetical protein